MSWWITDGTDSGTTNTLRIFSKGLSERPADFGVSDADAAEAARLVQKVDELTLIADTPATRTPLTITARREALTAARKFCTALASFIRTNPYVSDADRLLIGVPGKAEKRRVPAPTTAAMLAIRGIIPGGHLLEFVDSTTPDRRSKPDGVRALELFVAYAPPQSPTDGALSADLILKTGKQHSVLTRSPAKVLHPNDRVGSIANYIGRWLNGRNEPGPWSQPVRMTLAMPGEFSASEAA